MKLYRRFKQNTKFFVKCGKQFCSRLRNSGLLHIEQEILGVFVDIRVEMKMTFVNVTQDGSHRSHKVNWPFCSVAYVRSYRSRTTLFCRVKIRTAKLRKRAVEPKEKSPIVVRFLYYFSRAIGARENPP